VIHTEKTFEESIEAQLLAQGNWTKVDRFAALNEEKRDAFRNPLGAFVRLYAFLSQIMPFSDPDLEMRYAFCRFLEMRPDRMEQPEIVTPPTTPSSRHRRSELARRTYDGFVGEDADSRAGHGVSDLRRHA
jgi:hypothetical protein